VRGSQQTRASSRHHTFFTGGIFHDPSIFEGSLSSGQFNRIIRTKSPGGAGSQFDSLSTQIYSKPMRRGIALGGVQNVDSVTCGHR
jgi:hypothetical protein